MSLQDSYNNFTSSSNSLINLIEGILSNGEFTEEDKNNLNNLKIGYNSSYIDVKEELQDASNIELEKKIIEISSKNSDLSQLDVFNALTNNGQAQGIFIDEETEELYINAEFLQTRGLRVVNDNGEQTLYIDEHGNLTTSGDIVGGTITGTKLQALTIDTNEVNIESQDGGMILKGALQKFTDENGKVRILIGKDTDNKFKFLLFGENGETILIDKDGIKADAIASGTIIGTHIKADTIEGTHIKADVIEGAHIKGGSISGNHIQGNVIIGNHIEGDTITGDKIKGNTIEGIHIKGETIEGSNIKGNTITGTHIKGDSIGAEHIQAGSITAGSTIIVNGAIGSAQISELDAGKITTGKIDTSKVEVSGADGHLRIKGNRMQVFQGVGNQAKERVSVGDVNGDGTIYGLRVRGSDGQTVLLDENGVKPEGITDGSITNDKINSNANIDGSKININSVVDKINEDGSTSILGTKIEVGDTNLNVKLSNITETQTEHDKSIGQAQTDIKANAESIKLKVDNATYTIDKNNMTQSISKNTGSIETLQDQIKLKVESSHITTAIDNLEIGGRNLLPKSSKELREITFGGWDYYFPNNLVNWSKGEVLTGRIYLKPTNENASCMLHVRYKDSTYTQFRGTTIKAGSEGYSTVTITVPNRDDISHIQFSIRHDSGNIPSDKVYYKEEKVEKGNKATDWSLAPEDIDNQFTTINEKMSEIEITDDKIISTVKEHKTDGKNTFTQQSDIKQLNDSWTATFKDGYSQGITTINKDGVTVISSNVKSKTQMTANGFCITNTNTGLPVFKVNADGTLTLEGNITVTGGKVPTTVLNGVVPDANMSTDIKNGASAGTNAKKQVDNWTYSGTTEINGNSIRTGTLDAGKITTGTLDANKVTVTNLNASNIKSGTISADRISVDTLRGKTIESGKINGGEIIGGKITGAVLTSTLTSNGYTNEVVITSGSLTGGKSGSGLQQTFELLGESLKFTSLTGTSTSMASLSAGELILRKGDGTYPIQTGSFEDGYNTILGQNTKVVGNLSVTGTIYGKLSGNANTATTLQTARTINGTSFNGSGNITTANWGTARNLTIGKTAKSVNGSVNVAWSLSEIGAVSNSGDTINGALEVTGGVKSTGIRSSGELILACDNANIDYTGNASSRIRYRVSSGNYYFDPHMNNTVRLGSTTYSWNVVYAQNGVNTTSDRNAKENIKYINKNNDCFSNYDMYKFIKEDYLLAQYNYIGDEVEDEKISAIAQDLLVNTDGTDNELGQLVVNYKDAVKNNKEGENPKLSISQTQLLNVAIGALQQAMLKIEELEKRIGEII